MKFMVCVYESKTPNSHSESEVAAIDALNDELESLGYRFFAGGMEHSAKASIIDARSGTVNQSSGPIFDTAEYLSGFWILDVPDEETAKDVAIKASRACNRRIELRKFLGQN